MNDKEKEELERGERLLKAEIKKLELTIANSRQELQELNSRILFLL